MWVGFSAVIVCGGVSVLFGRQPDSELDTLLRGPTSWAEMCAQSGKICIEHNFDTPIIWPPRQEVIRTQKPLHSYPLPAAFYPIASGLPIATLTNETGVMSHCFLEM